MSVGCQVAVADSINEQANGLSITPRKPFVQPTRARAVILTAFAALIGFRGPAANALAVNATNAFLGAVKMLRDWIFAHTLVVYELFWCIIACLFVLTPAALEILLVLPLRIVRPILAYTTVVFGGCATTLARTVYGGCATTLARTIDLLAAVTR